MANEKKWDAFFNRSSLTTADSAQVMILDTTEPDVTKQNQRTPVTQLLRSGKNLSELASASTARTNLGLGSMAIQDKESVDIEGGTGVFDNLSYLINGGVLTTSQTITASGTLSRNYEVNGAGITITMDAIGTFDIGANVGFVNSSPTDSFILSAPINDQTAITIPPFGAIQIKRSVAGTPWLTISDNATEGADALLKQNNLSDLASATGANTNLGGLTISSSYSIVPSASQILGVPCPKVVRMTFGNTSSKLIMPQSNVLGSPNANSPGLVVLINEGNVEGTIYSYGTDGSDGTFLTSIPALTGLIAWNEDNSTADGAWEFYDYITLPQLGLLAEIQTTDATPTTLLSIPVEEGSQVLIEGTYSASTPTYSSAQGGPFSVSAIRGVGGVVTLVGTPLISAYSMAPPTLDAYVNVGDNTLRLRATGIIATTYDWNANYLVTIS
jgi:hypothetical protein